MSLIDLWSPATLTALSAVGGSVVGALGSSVSAWVAQRHQDRRELLAKKISHREKLYSDFIDESARAIRRAPGARPVWEDTARYTINRDTRSTIQLGAPT